LSEEKKIINLTPIIGRMEDDEAYREILGGIPIDENLLDEDLVN
jgi:hypothetical protein